MALYSSRRLPGLLVYGEGRNNQKDVRWLAYDLATAHHEGERKIHPIKKYSSASYLRRIFDIN